MRQLTDTEQRQANHAFAECDVEASGYQGLDRKLFQAGFAAGLDHNQAKLEAIQTFLDAFGRWYASESEAIWSEEYDTMLDAWQAINSPIQPDNSQNADKNLAKNETVEVTK